MPPAILRPFVWRDLFGLSTESARAELLAALGGPWRPSTRPPFPLPESGPNSSIGRRPILASRTLTGHSGAVYSLASSVVNGGVIAISGGADRVLRVWDLTTGTLQAALGHHTDPVSAIDCIAVDGKQVAVSVGYDKVLRIWDLASGAVLGTPHRLSIERAFKYAFKYNMRDVACCYVDGRPVAVTMETEARGINDGDDNRVRIWDLSKREFEATLFHVPERSPLRGLACTVLDGQPVVVIAREYGKMQLFDLRRMRQIRPPIRRWGLEPAHGLVSCSVDGKPLAISYGLRADVWDISTRKRLFSLEAGNGGNLSSAACGYLNDRPICCIGGSDSRLRIWDLRTHGLLANLTAASKVTAVALAGPAERPVVLVGCSSGEIHVWDLVNELDNR